MADIIQLLPDAIANQIAAGEVIQRPASVVKELLENAIDAGATEVRVVVKDAGKTLIQVVDNGSGMSDTDARMCLERHATSKIRKAGDLFAIRTMGFRGEAMASIAAIAQMEIRTRQESNELGTRIVVEGSKVKTQEPCQQAVGTSVSVRNIFFNVPARRNFLKSDTVEMKHLVDEFQRVALANHEVFFSLTHNDNELLHLPAGNLRQRLVGVFGSNHNKKLVPVSEETDVVRLHGFVGKPEFARKTRGEQFFFVNDRFIRSGYLHHAVMNAFDELLPDDTHPFYVIFIEIDPSRIDINVHPTKQEIKFDDERLIYQYLRVAVRHALAQYAVIPSIDFDQDPSLSAYPTLANRGMQQGGSSRPAGSGGGGGDWGSSLHRRPKDPNLENWQKLYEGLSGPPPEQAKSEAIRLESSVTGTGASGSLEEQSGRKKPYQLHNLFIISPIKSGYLLIDQQAAHERILFEHYLEVLSRKRASSQKELFPETLKLSAADASLLRSILETVNQLGFDVQEFGADTFVVHGCPSDMPQGRPVATILDQLIGQVREEMSTQAPQQEEVARSLARSAAIKRGMALTETEMQELIDQLFACEMPYKSPFGKACFLAFDLEELKRKFDP